MSTVQRLHSQALIKPPRFVHANIAYETIMGSEAYGCADTSSISDRDLYGFCIPDKGIIFPHTIGIIHGFDKNVPSFDSWTQHHIIDKSAGGMSYDIVIYSIVKYFALCMECNPNMIDSMFTPERCVTHRSNISRMVRDRRKLFLHKRCWHTFRGYAHQQHHKMEFKGRTELREFQAKNNIPKDTTPETLKRAVDLAPYGDTSFLPSVFNYAHPKPDVLDELIAEYEKLWKQARKVPDNPKRAASVEKWGYDVKFFYHIVRLMDECEQILTEYDLDLERSRETLKAIRRGEWPYEKAESYLATREKQLEGLYDSSKIPHGPDEEAIKTLLMECLEEHFGSLNDVVGQPDAATKALRQIQDVIYRNAHLLP